VREKDSVYPHIEIHGLDARTCNLGPNLYTLPSELHEIKHAIQSLMQSSLSEIARNQAGPPVLDMDDNESN
jgi:hypothetical protein